MAAKRDLFDWRKITDFEAIFRNAVQKGRFRITDLGGDAAHFRFFRQGTLKKRDSSRIAAKRHICKRIDSIRLHMPSLF